MPEANYGYTDVSTDSIKGKVYRLTSFVGPDGVQFSYEYNGPEFRLSKIYRGAITPVILLENSYSCNNTATVTDGSVYCDGKITSQKDAVGNVTNYSGGHIENMTSVNFTTTVTFPDLSTEILYFGGNRAVRQPLPKQIDMPSGRQKFFEYDQFNRVTKVGNSLGDKDVYQLDSRGNIIKITHSPKALSSDSVVTENWSYPACDSSNFRICNKPEFYIGRSYVDGGGKRTDYRYDSSNGQILVKLDPSADDYSKRPVTIFKYAAFYPAAGVVASAGVALTSTFLLTTIDNCTSSTVAANVLDFTYVCPSGSRVRTSRVFTPSTSSNRTSYELEGIIYDADSAAIRSCIRYDSVGNTVAESTPRSTATCP